MRFYFSSFERRISTSPLGRQNPLRLLSLISRSGCGITVPLMVLVLVITLMRCRGNMKLDMAGVDVLHAFEEIRRAHSRFTWNIAIFEFFLYKSILCFQHVMSLVFILRIQRSPIDLRPYGALMPLAFKMTNPLFFRHQSLTTSITMSCSPGCLLGRGEHLPRRI